MTGAPAWTRRGFLRCSAGCALAFLPGVSRAGAGGEAAAGVTGGSAGFYLARRDELVARFREVLEGARQLLTPSLGEERTAKVTKEAMAVFQELIPGLPDVGGARNWDSPFLPMAAWCVALHRPLRAEGRTAEDVGKLVYDLHGMGLRSTPPARAQAEQEETFGAKALGEMREWADWTRKREYPANWVATFLPGDGVSFDFGYDYTECALVKYFAAQGVPELAPYPCVNDFARSAAIGTGLRRTGTLATGDGVCDFRFRRGRKVTQDWSTEIVRIRARRPAPPAPGP